MATFEDHEVKGAGVDPALSNLAYLDVAYDDPEIRRKVASLLADELARSDSAPARDARQTDGVAEASKKWPLGECVRNEVLRQRNGKGMDKIDFKGRLDTLRGRAKTAAEKIKVERLRAAYAGIEQTNGHLSQRFGKAEWNLRVCDLEGVAKKMEYDLEKLRAEVESVNQTREMEQAGASRGLSAAKDEHMMLVRKNAQILSACAAMELEAL